MLEQVLGEITEIQSLRHRMGQEVVDSRARLCPDGVQHKEESSFLFSAEIAVAEISTSNT